MSRLALLRVRPSLEQLENRVLLRAGDSLASAIGLSFLDTSTTYQTSHITENFIQSGEVLLYRINLDAGDVVTAEINTTPYGGSLNSYLRIFQDSGAGNVRQIAANDDFQWHDAGLTFQAATTGTFYIGISSSENTTYDPRLPGTGSGSSQGLFDLDLRKTSALLQANLVVASLRLAQPLAVWGDAVTLTWTVENRGGQAAELTELTLLLASDRRFTQDVMALQTTSVALDAGAAVSGSFTVTLDEPDIPLPAFSDAQELFLGLQLGLNRPASPGQGNDWVPLQMLGVEEVVGAHTSPAVAQPLALNSRTQLTLAAGEQSFVRLALTQPGNLTSWVEALTGHTSLALYDSRGLPLVQSNGQSASNHHPFLTHGLSGDSGGTTYYLRVANRGSEAITCSLTILFTPSDSLLQTVPLGTGAVALVRGDFNGDGQLDLITANLQNFDFSRADDVRVLLGHGDGTFQDAGSVPVGLSPNGLCVGDFDGDGRLDLAVIGSGTNGVRVLLGQGDGTFQDFRIIAVEGGTALAAGDFNGDGWLDLAVATPFADTVTILLGDGQGGFQSESSLAVPGQPTALASGDFDEDGRLDLLTADRIANQVTLLRGQGAGTFQNVGSIAVGTEPIALVAVDLNGDGHLDVATADLGSETVTVLLGDGHGTLQPATTAAVGDLPKALVSGDFDGDGHLDLAVANASNDVTVLLGNGPGTFQAGRVFAVGNNPQAVVAGDFDGDGSVDLATANYSSGGVTVLLGNGQGTFPETASTNQTGQQPSAVAAGDFNGDGRVDLAATNSLSSDVTVLLGQGDGTFQPGGTVAGGTNPIALVAGDFNGDGRLDVASADFGYDYGPNAGPAGVTILLGQGDGTLSRSAAYHPEGRPAGIVAGDFNEDGHLDLAIATRFNADFSPGSSVILLLGDGRGNFTPGGSVATGSEPRALVLGDFDGDTHLDLATANYSSADVTVLLGDGRGQFREGGSFSTGNPAVALVTGDLDGDSDLDLAVGTLYYSGITALLNDGHAGFSSTGLHSLQTNVTALLLGDFNGDGFPDLAATSDLDTSTYLSVNQLTVLQGDGQGGFSAARLFPTGNVPRGLASADFNRDGRADLVSANFGDANLTVYLGTGTGNFLPPVLAPSPVQSTPVVADWTGDGALDAVVLTETGRILFRAGLGTQSGVFAPPVILNTDPNLAARDLALVPVGGGSPLLAALDVSTFPVSASPTVPQVARVTLYQPQLAGNFGIISSVDLPGDLLPANIAAADLTGNGLGDLVITAATANRLFVALQVAPGLFTPPVSYFAGSNPSAIELLDLDEDQQLDIVVTDRFAGQVSVLVNQGNGSFAFEQRFRAGTGLYGLTTVGGGATVQALEGTVGLAAGSFDEAPGLDLMVLNRGTQRLDLLSGDGAGGFRNPVQEAVSPSAPSAMVAAHFLAGGSQLDLAMLSREAGTIAIYRAAGAGEFTLVSTLNAGNQPTGLGVADVARPGGGGPDGILDLLVGNTFGDLLILTGNGDGTFTQYRRANQKVSLAVADASAGAKTFLFSNQGNDRLAFRTAARGAAVVAETTVYQDRSGGIQAPGPQQVVTVQGTQYLVVANSGSNQVLLYTLDADGHPDPASAQTFATGTDPVCLTVTDPDTDLNGDSIPDLLVANQGSNAVSVFIGQLIDNTWTLSPRPRQNSGGLGPSAVVVADVTGAAGTGPADGIPDLLVTNAQSNEVSVLPGRGDGFFINQPTPSILSLPTGIAPLALYVGDFDDVAGKDLVTVNSGSSNVTLISNFLAVPVISTFSSGGTFPVATVAVDVNANGITDLLIANAGTGTVQLLLGGAGGFQESPFPLRAELPPLADLALVVSGNELQVYGTEAGREIAVLLATFGPTPPPPSFLPPGPGFPAGLDIVTSELRTFPPSTSSVPLLLQLVADASFESSEPLAGVVRSADNANPDVVTVGGGEPNTDSGEPEAAPTATSQRWGQAGRVLLLNLSEPPPQDNPELEQPGNPSSPESPPEDSSPLDEFWSAVGAGRESPVISTDEVFFPCLAAQAAAPVLRAWQPASAVLPDWTAWQQPLQPVGVPGAEFTALAESPELGWLNAVQTAVVLTGFWQVCGAALAGSAALAWHSESRSDRLRGALPGRDEGQGEGTPPGNRSA